MRPALIFPRAARAAAVLAAALGVASTAADAQTPAGAAPRVARPTVTQTATLNLLALPFGAASAEYERAVGTGGFAVGVGGLTTFGDVDDDDDAFDDGDDRFSSLQAKLKYYPSENGLRGLAVGVTAGVARATDVRTNTFFSSTGQPSTVRERRTRTAPTLGVVLDYNYLVGRRRRFVVGLGIGARRVLDPGGPLGEVIPDGRFQVGFGF